MHYLASREELFEELLRSRDTRDQEARDDPEPSFEGYLRVVAHNRDLPGLVLLFLQYSAEACAPEHPSRQFFIDRYAQLRELLAAAVERAQDEGDLGPNAEPSAVAELIIATTDGLQVQWSLRPEVDMVARLRELWDGIRRSSWAER